MGMMNNLFVSVASSNIRLSWQALSYNFRECRKYYKAHYIVIKQIVTLNNVKQCGDKARRECT